MKRKKDNAPSRPCPTMIENEDKRTFIEHIIELRRRLTHAAIAVAIGFGAAYYYSDVIYVFLAKPAMQGLPKGQEYLVFTGIVEPFFIYFKIGFVGGVVLASPVIMYEIWAFAAPGLLEKEKRWFAGICLSSAVLFLAGVVFAFYLVFPFGFKYLLSFANDGLRPMISMSDYFSLVTKLLLAFGVTFQLPLGMLVLARMGVVTARRFASWWRYAIIIIFIAAAILTPTPDIFNQLLMAGPLIILYGIGVLGAWVFGKKKAQE
ncbi:MAG: twin-arginine translocase subunit TatC [Deltaproteobacteria bacterium]|nr:twin-arginine translocase subunit TatC [Deltaproteobacteria bacterium]